ncbi:MAG TPA: hypothetical protein VN827_05315 [Chthoniobacterales bacterium]|nr:hypothetical protein [Chthoniobacterales bacterium]
MDDFLEITPQVAHGGIELGEADFHHANYARVSQRQSSFVLLNRIEDRAVLVAFIQGVVGALDENPCPFDEAGGKETGEGADEDFLEEGRVHSFLTATIVPVAKLFIDCFDNVSSARELQNSPCHG